MKKPYPQIKSTVVVLITLSSLFISLTPLVRAQRPLLSAPANVQAKAAAKAVSEPSADAAKLRAREAYGNLPLSFEQNQGQSDENVKFLSRGQGYMLFLTATEAVLTLHTEKQTISPTKSHNPKIVNHDAKSAVLRMTLLGARPDPQIEGRESLEGRVNYLLGNDQSQWQRNVPTYREVRYSEVWPGIDMVWHGKQRELEYDFIVQPGADPSQVLVAFDGVDKLRLDGAGNLLLRTKAGEVVQHAPVIYQDGNQGREMVSGKYLLKGMREVGFEVESYDKSRPLVIDPLLIYSTYLGGNDLDEPFGIAVDSSGHAYIAGETRSADFPLRNAIVSDMNVSLAFITKLNASGTDIVYSTFLGDADGFVYGDVLGTEARGIAVTSDGKACITGATVNDGNTNRLPITANAYQDNGKHCTHGACTFSNRVVDAFVTVLNPDGGSVFYSTFFGGSEHLLFESNSLRAFDAGNAIAVDSSNLIYIAGVTSSQNLPTKNAFQPSNQSSGEETDAFIAVFDPTQERGNDTLLYSSFLGGKGDDVGRGIAVDGSRNAYVVGSTSSTDLSTKSPEGQALPPLQRDFQGGGFDGFVTKVDTAAAGDDSLTYQTYFGGNINDRVEAVAVDSLQRAYITGASNSSPGSFPLRNAFDSTQTNGEAFVAKLNADGTSLFYCSFLGGDNANTPDDGEEGLGIAIDSAGNAYVTGRTTSGASFPVGAVALPFPAGIDGTAFLAKIGATVSNNTTATLLYSTTFGGRGARGEAIALDAKGNVYLTGSAAGDLPTTPDAFQTTFNGGSTDGFVAKLSTSFNDTIGVYRPANNLFALRNSNTAGIADITITFGSAGDLPITGDWDGNGIDDVGVFRPSTGQFQLRIPNGRSFTTITLNNFGQSGDLPVAGDWNSDGIDTRGVFRPSSGQWLLTNGPNTDNTIPPVNFDFIFGQNGDTPLVGDWNGDGFDTPGLFINGIAQFNLSNGLQGTIDISPFLFGSLGSLALAGDWDGDGVATIGVFNPATGSMSLNNTNTSGNGSGDLVFFFGQNGDRPLAGDWDGQPPLPTN